MFASASYIRDINSQNTAKQWSGAPSCLLVSPYTDSPRIDSRFCRSNQG